MFRVRGDTIELFPAHYEDRAWRIGFFGDEIESIAEFDPLTGKKTQDLEFVKIYANSPLRDAAPDAAAGDRGDQGGAEAHGSTNCIAAAACSRRSGWSSARLFDLEMMEATGSCAGHRELFALSDRPPARRAAADLVRISARQCAGLRRREPCHGAADRRHVSRRLSAQGDARRIWLPPAVLHRQPAAALRGMGGDAAADGACLGDARQMGDGAHRRRLRRAGDPPDRPHRSAGRSPPGAHARSTICSAK